MKIIYIVKNAVQSSIYGETACENVSETWNRELQNIQEINVDNFDLINNQTNGTWIFNTDVLESFISDGIISSIDLSRYGCTVGSLHQNLILYLNIKDEESDENVDPSAIRILTYALEPEKMGLRTIL